VGKGQFTALLGPNGAGKSTLFSLACALMGTRDGDLQICDHSIARDTRKALSQLGIVFQQSTLDLDLTVAQNLRYFASLHGISGRLADKRIQEELERLNLFDRRAEKVRLLNGGHRRRVEIARALLHDPAVLLLDEATVGLDVQTRSSLVEHVHQLCIDKGVGVLWATHLIDEIKPSDQVVILHQGRVVADGAASMYQDETLETAFQRLTQQGGRV
jgi:ABC-2 type transport system ATP-binding protein